MFSHSSVLGEGVKPLCERERLGSCRAECYSEPSQKHLGYLPPQEQQCLFIRWDEIIPYDPIMSFELVFIIAETLT